MTRFDSYDITYDAIGNPVSYASNGFYTFVWSGRELMGATVDGISYSFSYNADGLRATKEGGGNYITYYDEGNRLIAESLKRLWSGLIYENYSSKSQVPYMYYDYIIYNARYNSQRCR